jgi:hypothetical protein
MRGDVVLISTHGDAVVVVEALVIQQPHAACAVRLAPHAADGL